MSTPTQHATSRITRAGAILDHAITRPQTERRDLFQTAWRIAHPQFHALAVRYLGGITGYLDHDLHDEALSFTGQKLWRSVERGYTPTNGYESVLAGIVARSTADAVKRYGKIIDNPTMHMEMRSDPDDERNNWLVDPTDHQQAVIDNDDQQHLRRRLQRAATRAALLDQPLASALLRRGLDDSNASIARALNVDPKDITVAIEWIRTEQYALLTASDTRFEEYLEEIHGVRLFTMAASA